MELNAKDELLIETDAVAPGRICTLSNSLPLTANLLTKGLPCKWWDCLKGETGLTGDANELTVAVSLLALNSYPCL